MALILAGDVGGTKTLLAAAQSNPEVSGCPKVLLERRYESRAYSDFFTVLRDFLSQLDSSRIDAACFAVAGPVEGSQVKVTNLPWRMDAHDLEKRFGIPRVRLLNDFEAIALGIEALGPGDLVTLQPGQPAEHAMQVVLGAGTGMGVAWLAWRETRYAPLPTEAGHMDFAPTNDLQVALFDYLKRKFGHVSWERVLSGPGLVDIFSFLQGNIGASHGLAQVSLPDEGGAEIVSDLALNRKHPIAVKAIELFIECYGAFAGNLALAGLAKGGVYLAGGIAPRIIDPLRQGTFIQSFCDKGRFAGWMQQIPVRVVMNPAVGLLGAVREVAKST